MMLNFDATKFNPEQGMAKHPVGKFPAIVSDVSVEENKNKDGGYFSIMFATQSGAIRKNYNLWFANPSDGQKQAIDIANRQLSALCHAVGIFRLGDGRELLNARCQIEVTPQAKNDQYNEVSKVYDANGNEPGKAPATAAQSQASQGGWAPNGGAPQAPDKGFAGPNWQQGPSAPASGSPQSNITRAILNEPIATPAAPGPSWQQGPSTPAGGPPPWASK